MKHFFTKSIFQLLLSTLICSFSFGQTWDKVVKAVADDRAYLASYGFSVAVSGNYAVVGSIGAREDADGNNSLLYAGAAYILFNDGSSWKQVKKINVPIRQANDYFGFSVGISGNYVVVSAAYEDGYENETINDAGAAYIFEKNRGGNNMWGLVTKITAPTRRKNSYFGYSVAINGDYVIVGAYEDNVSGDINTSSSGAAYIFKKDQSGMDSWGLLKTLTASDMASGNQFGSSVAMSANYAIVGAQQESQPGATLSATGAAYIFRKNEGGADSWEEVKKLEAPVKGTNDYFGKSVAITDEYAVAGAVNDAEDKDEINTMRASGSAYVFKNYPDSLNNWAFIKKITANIRHEGASFGQAVAINGNTILVSAHYDDYDAQDLNYVENSGAAYVFSKNIGGVDGWGQQKKITATVRAGNSNFGLNVAMSNQNIMIGANLENNDASEGNTMLSPGAVYIYSSSIETPLPVTLAGFSVVKIEKQSLLNWRTTSESLSDYFEIQRSTDGKKWSPIGNIPAARNSNAIINYSFTDPLPVNGENLYRLKIVDTDKTFAYSTIRTISFEELIYASVYPNPVADKLYIPENPVSVITALEVISPAGKVVVQSKMQREISVQNLQTGLYILRITYADGQTTSSKFLVGK